jgi:2-amino-4-hydroxy-6-hydroxymethyldihydropteridine diphosphokinase
MYRIFVGVGSNIGEREKFLDKAVAALRKLPGTKMVWTSSVYESEPWGNPNQGKFLNAVAELESDFAPGSLLKEVKSIEENIGKRSSERWGPREIDIDILLYDGLVEQTEEICIPHKELGNRKFVLIPLKEIAPDVVHPVNGMTIEELAGACKDTTRVVKSSHHIKI